MKKLLSILIITLVGIQSSYGVNVTHLDGDKLSVTAFCCDSTETIMMMGLGSSLWRSEDGGSTWEPKRQDIIENSYGFVVQDLFMLDALGDTVFAKVQVNSGSNFWQYAVSIDAGITWRKLRPQSNGNHDHHLVVAKENHSKLIHIDSHNISVSEDFGYHWDSWIHDPQHNQNSNLFQHPDNSEVFYMSGWANNIGGVFKSENYGETWQPLINAPALMELYGLYISDVLLMSNNELLASPYLGHTDDTWNEVIHCNTLLRSADGGTSWVIDEAHFPPDFAPVQIIESSETAGIILAKGNFMGIPGGYPLYRSTDYGYTFSLVEDCPHTWIDKISQNEFSGNMYSCTGNKGVYKSEDSGLTWQLMDFNLDVSIQMEYEIKDGVICSASKYRPDPITLYNKNDGSFTNLAYPELERDTASYMFHDLIMDNNIFYAFQFRHTPNLEYSVLQPLVSHNRGQTWEDFAEEKEIGTYRQRRTMDLFQGEQFTRLVNTYKSDVNSIYVDVSVDTGQTWICNELLNVSTNATISILQTEESIYLLIPTHGIYESHTNGQDWQEMQFPNVSDLNGTRLFLLENEDNGYLYLFGLCDLWEWNGNEWNMCGASLADVGNLMNIGIIPGETPRFVGTEGRNFLWYKESPEARWSHLDVEGDYIEDLNNFFYPKYDSETNRVWLSTHLGLYYFNVEELSSVDSQAQVISTEYQLLQTHPNPFNASTKIEFILERPGEVSLKLYDINGRLVRELLDEKRQAGKHTLSLDGTQLASGTYFLKMDNGQQILSKKLVLIK